MGGTEVRILLAEWNGMEEICLDWMLKIFVENLTTQARFVESLRSLIPKGTFLTLRF